MKIILASKSGVRKKILDKFNINNEVIVSNVNEDEVKESLLAEGAEPLEISKNLEDPSKIEDMIDMLDERKKEPIDYRRTGVVTLFTGLGLFLFGVFFLGSVLKGVGALVAAIGLGQIIAGYLYPNTSEELTSAVEDFEKK